MEDEYVINWYGDSRCGIDVIKSITHGVGRENCKEVPYGNGGVHPKALTWSGLNGKWNLRLYASKTCTGASEEMGAGAICHDSSAIATYNSYSILPTA